jgi:hypothetical protein
MSSTIFERDGWRLNGSNAALRIQAREDLGSDDSILDN